MRVSDDLMVGSQLAGYRIESLLGRGGMSFVYLAEDLRLKRRVAVKVLVAGHASETTFRERFLAESELAASIDHPNIVPIYEAGETDELLYIAMRYVKGGDLRRRLQEGPLDPDDALALLTQVASALDAAHARGLVHRDVKPSNVLLDTCAGPGGSDHAYLADFGLVTRLTSKAAIGDDGHLTGTIDYVAPEQIAGGRIDGRADVYSLGCLLYECLAGQPPYPRESDLAVVYAHLEEQPPKASAHRPDVPAAFDPVIAKALAKEADQRYPSCRELARAALAVTVDEASRLLVDAASRAAAGRSDLSQVETQLAGKVIRMQLVRDRARLLTEPRLTAAEGVCPFKGLACFETVDADYFYGRERLVGELVARLAGATFLGIVGPSGSGKSSVLRAGLLPAIASGALPGSERWRRVLLRPGERPMEELHRTLGSDVAEALAALEPGERFLLAVDQLEELFTACTDEGQRTAFTDALTRVASDPQGRAMVAVAVRADYYGRFAAFPALAPRLGAHHLLVGAMQASELRRAIELPAGRVGLNLEPELADALVDDVEGEPGALPLLSTALLELWQKRTDGALTLAAYRESGGVHGAVARLAESTYARVPDEHKPLVRAIMLRLVGEGEGDAVVRRRAPLTELDLERNDDAGRVVAALADSRLVTVSEGSIEVAHEALLREWPRLCEWIEDDGQGRRLRRHITEAARDWDESGRDRAELYRGARLAAALDWSADHAFELNELEREFVAESRDASERETRRVRRTNRRLRALLVGVAVLLAAAVAGGVLALVQRGEARDAATEARKAETAQLAQRLGAQALVEEDLDRSLLLARQAVAVDDTPQTRGYLLADLLRAPAAIGIMHGTSDLVRDVAISPDGRTLAVADFFGGLFFFDALTYEQIGRREPRFASTFGLAYSPDGERLAVGGNSPVRLLDARTRKVLAEADVGSARLAFTTDGSQLVVLGSAPGTQASITVHDAATLEQVGAPIELEGFTTRYVGLMPEYPHFALTPDGSSIVTASDDGELAWWSLESGGKTRTLSIAGGHHALAVSPNGLLAAVGIERGIQLVDLRTDAVRTATGTLAGSPTWVLFSPDSETVVTTSLDGTVTLWDAKSGVPRETLRGHSDSVQQPVFSPDGETLYTASHDGTAIAWDVTGNRGLGRPFRFTHDRVFHVGYDRHPGEFSPDGRLIALGLKERGIALWDGAELAPIGEPLRETGGEVKVVAFSPDGRTLAAGATGGMVTLWDVPSRSLRHGPFRAALNPIIGVSISADGTTLATAGGAGVRLWDVATGAPLGRMGGAATSYDVAFSPVGSTLAFVRADDGDAELWDVAERSRLARLRVEPGRAGEVLGFAVAFSPDGKMIATSGLGQPIYLWDTQTGRLIRKLERAGSGVLTLDFSPDGTLLAASGFEPVATLWDVATGTQIGPRLTAGNRRAHVDLSPDGHSLLLTHGNGQGALWDIDPKSWARRACALAGRTLNGQEWAQFLPGRPYQPACTT